MAEPPANWDQQDDENSTLSSKLGRLNVNAMEFVPSFGSGFSFTPKVPTIPQPTVPKPPPSTPIVPQNTNENENEKKETEPVIQVNELNVQQQVKEPITTTEEEEEEEEEYDELPEEDNES